MKLGTKIMSSAAIAVIIATIGSIVVTSWVLREKQIRQSHDNMESMIKQAETVRENFDRLHTAGAFDIQKMVDQLKTTPLKKSELYQTIPVVAAWQSITPVADAAGYRFQTPSAPTIKARNPANEFSQEFKAIFDAFEGKNEDYFSSDNGFITFARPVKLTESCLTCHGNPANSPTKDGLDLAGLPMEDMKVGDLKGAFVLSKAIDYSEANAAAMRIALVGLMILSGVLFGFYFISRGIIRPINRAVSLLGAGSAQISAAASQVSEGAQRIAQGASEQAASLEETTASLEQLSATCRQNADNARQANALAGEASQTSEGGEAAARKAATEVAAQLKELAVAIEAIRQSTDKTTAVVESIDDIAIQINLLALNAAVEAARAGEAGMGFAVVADEVRNLAARSTEEAKNTSALIKESRANAERVHAVAKAVQDHLAQSLDRDVVGNFQQLVGKVRKMSQLIAEVAAASDEQAKGVEQINAAVAQMDKVTQENAASAEQSAASSEEMQSQASGLQGTVAGLRKMVEGDHADASATAEDSVITMAQPRVGAAALRLPPKSAAKGGGKPGKPSQVLPLTDAEAAEHQGDFSRF